MNEIERRNLARVVELRNDPTKGRTLTGYAAVFNRYSQNLGGFVEQVDPGAFTKSLADATPVVARFNHDPNMLLGTTEAGTLRLMVDETGLSYEIDPPDTNCGRDTVTLADRGDVRYSSFAFRTIEDDWSMTEQGFPLRTLMNVQLVDVAPVVSPAYMDATAAVRSFAGFLHIEPEELKTATLEEIRSIMSSGKLPEHSEERSEDEDEGRQVENHRVSLQRQMAALIAAGKTPVGR